MRINDKPHLQISSAERWWEEKKKARECVKVKRDYLKIIFIFLMQIHYKKRKHIMNKWVIFIFSHLSDAKILKLLKRIFEIGF